MRDYIKNSFVKSRILVSFPAVLTTALVVMTVVCIQTVLTHGDVQEIRQKLSKAAQTESCVEPTAYMRRNHMDLLKHKREQTMRQGIRTDKHRLTDCISCHADRDESGQYISVTAEEQFCRACHQAVAVKPDCFDCHRSTPEVQY